MACPWIADIRRAHPEEIRGAPLRAKRRPPPANTSLLEVALGRVGWVPFEGTPLLSLADQSCGFGSRAEQVAM